MRTDLRRAPLLALAAFALAAAAASVAGRLAHHGPARRSDAELARHTPALGRPGYLGSDACAACHPAAHATWAATYHRTMTQRAGPGAVLAPFDGRELVAPDGARFRVERRGDEFWAELRDPEVRLARAEAGLPEGHVPKVWRRVAMTTGSHHMQVYWAQSPRDRRLHALPFAWLIDQATWVPVESTLLRPPQGDVVYTWNRACVPCHAVAGAPRLGDDAVDTRVVELGIACESCHGPGEAHAAAHQSPLARYLHHLSERPDPTIVNPARLDHRRASELCGQCHSVSRYPDEPAFLADGDSYRPGDPLEAHRQLVRHPVRAAQPWLDAVLDEDPEYLAGRMWSDGQVRVTGREYTALLETPCHTRGELSCLSCHQLHGADPDDQLAPAARGDAACTSCHAPKASREHTRHASLACVDCHMPRTTYGLLKAIRSHVIDSPDLATTLATGRPDACSLCHVDRPLAWTADWLARWYDRPRPDLPPEHRATSAAVLWAIRGDAGQRALAADALGHPQARAAAGDDWQAPILAHLLQDPYDAVRQIAARSLRSLPALADLDLDPLAPPAARAARIDAVLARWRAGPRPRPDPARLVTPSGDHDAAALTTLAAERDDRPIDLKE